VNSSAFRHLGVINKVSELYTFSCEAFLDSGCEIGWFIKSEEAYCGSHRSAKKFQL